MCRTNRATRHASDFAKHAVPCLAAQGIRATYVTYMHCYAWCSRHTRSSSGYVTFSRRAAFDLIGMGAAFDLANVTFDKMLLQVYYERIDNSHPNVSQSDSAPPLVVNIGGTNVPFSHVAAFCGLGLANVLARGHSKKRVREEVSDLR